MPTRVCDIEGCDREISEGTGSQGGLPICSRCRAALYTSKKNGVEWIGKRKAWLEFAETRLDYLHPRIVKMLADATRRVRTAKKLASKD